MAVAPPPPRPAGVRLDVLAEPAPATAAPVAEPRLPGAVLTVALFALAAVAYAVLGHWLIVDRHVVDSDAAARLARAFMALHDQPAKLSAIGFGVPPLPTVALLPLTLVRSLATSLAAIPLTAAPLGAAAVVVADRTLARGAIPVAARVPLVLAFAANPLVVVAATARPTGALELALVALTAYALVSWYATKEPRHLLAAGVAVALLVLTRYAAFASAALLAVLVAAALVHRRASRAEVEGSVLAFAAPVVYAAAAWVLVNAIVQHSPFGWIPGPPDADGTAMTAGDVPQRLLDLAVAVAPLAFAVVPALLVLFVVRRDHVALWLAALALGVLAVVGLHAWSADDPGQLSLDATAPLLVLAVAGAAWLHRALPRLRAVAWLATAALLALGVATAWDAARHDPSAGVARAAADAVRTGHDQHGLAAERGVAAFVRAHVHGRERVLADEAQAYGVILLSRRPSAFLDRADHGDSAWNAALDHPVGRVGWLLLATRPRTSDRVARRWLPDVEAGDPRLAVVLRAPGWVLVRISA